MPILRPLSTIEQAAAHLGDLLKKGQWSGTMPGVRQLTTELGVNHKTIKAALRLLEHEGLLQGQGQGRKRLIVMPEDFAAPALRVKILHYDEIDRMVSIVIDLQHQLMEGGHSVSFTPKSLEELGMNAKRVERMVNEIEADAWVVSSAPREVLEWFADRAVPAFAIFGGRSGVRLAGIGPDKLPALQVVVRRLVALGHQRIVMMLRGEHLKPLQSPAVRAFLNELEIHGIATGAYNLPEWEASGEGFRNCIDSLFRITPPSALILDEAYQFNVAQHHLARRGILAPEHISLVCSDPDPVFDWAYPSVAHISWDPQQVVRRIVRWADNVARGKDDRRQTSIKAEFIEGGTVGPVNKKS